MQSGLTLTYPRYAPTLNLVKKKKKMIQTVIYRGVAELTRWKPGLTQLNLINSLIIRANIMMPTNANLSVLTVSIQQANSNGVIQWMDAQLLFMFHNHFKWNYVKLLVLHVLNVWTMHLSEGGMRHVETGCILSVWVGRKHFQQIKAFSD